MIGHGDALAGRAVRLGLDTRGACPDGRYGRAFADLPPHEASPAQLMALGAAGGPMDAGAEPAATSTQPAGFTFLAQLIDHELTLDSRALSEQEREASTSGARPARVLDLDCVYGGGPDGAPHLYNTQLRGRFLVGWTNDDMGHRYEDLPRNQQGLALTGDPRNDDNLVLSRLHLVLIKAHNHLIASGLGFDAARHTLVFHFQQLVLHDFLPRLVGGALARAIEGGGRLHVCPEGEAPFLPLELVAAALRYGHVQLRDCYSLNDRVQRQPIGGVVGPRPLRTEIDLGYFFEVGLKVPQGCRTISRRMAPSLMRLQGAAPDQPSSLAQRDLLAGHACELPSGQAIARRMAADGAIPPDQVIEPDRAVRDLGMEDTPLWYYVLQEAETLGDGGRQLGPVGGRLVGEVLFRAIQASPLSCLDPDMRPPVEIPRQGSCFTMADLIRFATLG